MNPSAITTEMLCRVTATGERIASAITTARQDRHAALMHSTS